MTRFRSAAFSALVLTTGLIACGDDDAGGPGVPGRPAPVAVLAKAGDKTFVTDSGLAAFKLLIGGASNGSTVGTQATGFRPVNWDGVAAPDLNTNTFPSDAFFARGITTLTDGTGFRVDDSSFVSVANVNVADFPPFSGTKLFTAVGSRLLDAVFNVPGRATPAAVAAFGVVFVDNEFATSASIEAFDVHGASLGIFSAPATTSGNFSFVGVQFASPVIARVRIISGGNALGNAADLAVNAAAGDVVVMDDFVFSEPHSTF